jgi:DNA helicase-2/ATP-dependent DNA helicase PcrA
LEFAYVWVIAIVEQILPSWQSLKPGAPSAELEEERRNFFVAITRTQKRLVLSSANEYRGWQRQPSRFLDEMNLDSSKPRD